MKPKIQYPPELVDSSHAVPVLLEKLSKRFGYKVVINQIDLQIPKGTIFSILGPNGAGKSTLIKMIATILSPSSGRLYVFQQDTKEASPQLKQKIGYLAHQSLLYDEFTAWENLIFYQKLMGKFKNKETDSKQRLNTLIELFDIASFLHEPVSHLSSGQRKRVDFVRTFTHDPDLLVLDEAFTGLDEKSAGIIQAYLEQAKSNKTIILTTHNKELAYHVSDWICFLNKGKIQNIHAPKR